jgi:hypothetical protein
LIEVNFMLSQKEIYRAARFMQSYGELRPGFLDHDASNLEGPSPAAKRAGPLNDAEAAPVTAVVKAVKDSETGELRFLPK